MTKNAQPSRPRRLRELLTSKDTTILMEAHNGLSAKLAEEAGFEALWASGLAISAAFGVRDSNEASWTQVLDVIEFMADATSLPILLDGDTGYGNFNNVRRLVGKLEQRQVAGVCLEDKLFPKTNSFIDGEKQTLADVDEFCGKLRAAKDTQIDSDFVVVARTEAFIAGLGLNEALLRATAYASSGADVILCHSKRKDSADIKAFMQAWSGQVPVIIVPTKYPSEPLSSFVDMGVHNFIFANQGLRTVITALQKNLAKLKQSSSLMAVENDIVGVDEIFRLQNVQELKRSEERYLPNKSERQPRALVLAASKGDFGELVAHKPKAMLHVKGRPILGWQLETFRRQGIQQIAVVRGYRREAIDLANVQYFDNTDHDRSGELSSLYAARDYLSGDLVLSYGDVIFDDFILQNLLAEGGNIRVAVDAAWKLRDRKDKKRDLVRTTGTPDPLARTQCTLDAIGSDISAADATGEWVGLVLFREGMMQKVAELLDRLARDDPETLRTASVPDLLGWLLDKGESIAVAHSYGMWRDVDEEQDLLDAASD